MEEEEDGFRPPDRLRRQIRNQPLSLQELHRLHTERDASTLLMQLDRENSGFDLLLQNMSPAKLKITVQVLEKALINSSQIAQRQAVINVVTKLLDPMSDSFRQQLAMTGLHCGLRREQEFVKAVMAIVKLALQISPVSAAGSLAIIILNLEDTLNSEMFTDKIAMDDAMEEIKELQRRGARLPNLHPEIGGNDTNTRQRLRHRGENMDPTLFRELSIIPSTADFDPASDIEVRANKTNGAYENVNDYLDIQFRLLRADLLLPLRESILEYLADQERPQMRGIKVYREVRIVRPVCNDNGLCFRLSFDVTRTRRVNWSVSQRLKFGSLVCLSADNFVTYQCAVVDRNEPRNLEHGLVDVQFLVTDQGDAGAAVDESIALFAKARDLRFVMVESPAYFEAYKHVLRGLQNITENTFPFWRYIGECNRNVQAPLYLREHAGQAIYDMRPLVEDSYVIKDGVEEDDAAGHQGGFIHAADVAREVDILQLETWPNANTLSLDVSQYVALQSALTREFSIVQGPPGTGKTFLGLKIMKVLLHNRQIWAAQQRGQDEIGRNQFSPILLVCYTNHALDQFLEGVLQFFQGNLVRVGSRSKSEELDEYNLRSLRQRARTNRTVPVEIHKAKQNVRIDLKEIKATIHIEAAKLEILEREIVKETFLKDFIETRHWKQLTQRSKSGSVILAWLKIAAQLRRIEAQRDPQAEGHDTLLSDASAATDHSVILDEDLDEESDDEDDFFEIVTADSANRFLDIDDDDDIDFEDDEDDDLFAELREDFGNDYIDRVRAINRKLDDVDRETEKLRIKEVAFNISDYGEQEMPSGLSKKQKSHWKFVNELKKRCKYKLLGWLQNTDKMDEDEVSRVDNVWRLGALQRWRLYRYWVDLYCRQLRGEIRDTSRSYEEKARRYQEILHQEDKVILEKATVIGMTTTGAARYQAILREIGPRVVIVEEAAEVLEGHVLTSISEHCQHVVLIGDHKQLRPNPAVHRLKSECALDISLFERLINNSFRFDQLRYQHRMRQEISDLLKIRDLYPELQDHDKVKEYPDVRNVTTNVCFIQHHECDQRQEDTNTFCNHYEAKFIVGLCEYLLLQGYSPRQITVLSPYKGQIQLIKTQLKYMARSMAMAERMEKGGLKISSVDNYQGEENDIILLSLVRSNEENDIGFLKANNRLCVALSRAKHGLYVVGNLAGIAEKSNMMREILCLAKKKGFYKDHLSLSCPRHRGSETKIFKPDDFKKVADGGCRQPCQVRLDCGHACKRICHADDPKHLDAACQEPCGQLCEDCGQNCRGGHPCGKHNVCMNSVRKTIPMCGHVQDVPCYLSGTNFECQKKCEEKLPCGHMCQQTCGKRHNHTQDTCLEKIEVEPSHCGHGRFSLPCKDAQKGQEIVNLLCPEPCTALLDCEHICSGTCAQCLNGRLHINCQHICQKILICGHSCQDKCGSCSPCKRPCETACQHSHCDKMCGEPCRACLEPCGWQCPHHKCNDLCCQPCVRPSCDEPCSKRLACRHRCCGVCGEECPKLCSRCDVEKLKADSLYGYDGDRTTRFIQLDCDHVLEVEFVDQWMITDPAAQDGMDRVTIGLKTCPLCKIPIRKCHRYSNVIKRQLLLIEQVKKQYLGERRSDLKERLEQAINDLGVAERRDIQPLLQSAPTVLSETILAAQLRQVTLFRHIRVLRRAVVDLRGRFPDLQLLANNLHRVDIDLRCFEQWTKRVRTVFTQQNERESRLEHSRLRLLLSLIKLFGLVYTREGGQRLSDEQKDRIRTAMQSLSAEGQTSQEIIDGNEALVDELSKLVPDSHIALTAEERMAIVRAVNVSTGAWYQCPNGHIYAIGDCGQAMEEGRCPECKARIGGTNHHLLEDNAQAPEMDGAERPIWDNLDADRELAERLQRLEFEQL
ncbi:hypothetical protein EGW08_005198 [Elysia chlorotica]|uniref:RZ-type domain-containing protein n=1 Tax=Elysia chlorotica TaxID=188477 RepID=A0A433TZV5_ELYCH|nr:hypothetical protein EGW08_005198 [Elysia chlorotica]